MTAEVRFQIIDTRFRGATFDGAVRWVEKYEPAPHEKRLSTMGIQFTMVGPDFQKYLEGRIDRYIHELEERADTFADYLARTVPPVPPVPDDHEGDDEPDKAAA